VWGAGVGRWGVSGGVGGWFWAFGLVVNEVSFGGEMEMEMRERRAK